MSSMSRNAAISCSLVKSGTGPARSSLLRRWAADGTADLLVATAIWLLKKKGVRHPSLAQLPLAEIGSARKRKAEPLWGGETDRFPARFRATRGAYGRLSLSVRSFAST